MNKPRIAILITLLLTCLSALLVLFLPAPTTWDGTLFQFQLKLVIAVFIPGLHVLAALFFFLGLSGFKQEFRTAYRLIAAGVIGLGISLLASPAVTIFDLWDEWPMQLGLVCLPYIAAVLVIFVGIRTFFRKLDFKSIWRAPLTNIIFISTLVLLAIIMPHTPSSQPELAYDFGNAMFAATVGLLLVTAGNIFAVRKYVTPDYARVLMWLGIGLALVAALVGPSIILKAVGIDTRVAAGTLQDFLVLAAIPYLVAGYRFYLLTADTRSQELQPDASAVDVVVYVASLASNRQMVDPILDKLRSLTARLQPGQLISPADQAALGEVYLQLESYLTKQERLRAFTTAELRQKIRMRFEKANPGISQMFWSKLPLIK